MAIDSEVKRKSIVAIGAPYLGVVIVPDSSIDSADRQAIGYGYAGIAAYTPVAGTRVKIRMLRQGTQLGLRIGT